RAHERRALPVAERRQPDQPLAHGTAAVAPGHVGAGPGLVDEHQPVQPQLGYVSGPVLSGLLDVGPLLLGGVDHFFLNDRPILLRKAQSVPTLTRMPRRPRSSSRVASGSSLTRSRTCCSWGASLTGAPLLGGRGSMEPVWRRRCFSRRTQAGLTEYFRATALVPMPAPQSARRGWRRSSE